MTSDLLHWARNVYLVITSVGQKVVQLWMVPDEGPHCPPKFCFPIEML